MPKTKSSKPHLPKTAKHSGAKSKRPSLEMRRPLFVLAAIAAVSVVAAALFSTSTVSAGVTGKKIVLDPGHGGSDPGTTECSALYEKDANLQIARIVRDKLVADGASVIMTRDSDIGLGNTDRAEIANNAGGQVFVSVHLNGSTNHKTDSTEVLYGKKNKDYALAVVMHNAQYPFLGIADGKVTNFASGALLKADMPAVITESVFLSSTAECAKLTDGSMTRQNEIAQSIYNGIQEWFKTH